MPLISNKILVVQELQQIKFKLSKASTSCFMLNQKGHFFSKSQVINKCFVDIQRSVHEVIIKNKVKNSYDLIFVKGDKRCRYSSSDQTSLLLCRLGTDDGGMESTDKNQGLM